MPLTTKPKEDEFEVSLFGPGVGESVVVHLGGNEWMIVDSCRGEHASAALAYLRRIGVDPANVKLIVATHWHNDHVRGLHELVQACTDAYFFCSSALFSEEILALAELWDETASDRSAVSELYKITQFFTSQGAQGQGRIKFAGSNRRIRRRVYNIGTQSFECEIYSLSPSDFEIQRSHESIAALLPRPTTAPLVPLDGLPNDTSVVLHIRSGAVTVLLGADLENALNPHTGWNVIVDSPDRPAERASCLKVSHHSSHTGDDPRIWTNLLTAEPHAILTPFNSGSRPLPQPADIVRICGYTKNASITSPPRQRSRRSRTGAVGKLIHQRVKRIWTVDDGWSQLQLRRKLDGSDNWQTARSAGATDLCVAA